MLVGLVFILLITAAPAKFWHPVKMSTITANKIFCSPSSESNFTTCCDKGVEISYYKLLFAVVLIRLFLSRFELIGFETGGAKTLGTWL